jgi:hypothetical protein
VEQEPVLESRVLLLGVALELPHVSVRYELEQDYVEPAVYVEEQDCKAALGALALALA